MLYIENMRKESYIIGIDPGLVNTGWGIIKTNGNHIQFVSCGTISPNVKDNMAKTLQFIYSEIDNVCKQYFDENSVVDCVKPTSSASILKTCVRKTVAPVDLVSSCPEFDLN